MSILVKVQNKAMNKPLHRRTIPSKCVTLCKKLDKAENYKERQEICKQILTLLNEHFKLPSCKVKIFNKKYPVYNRRIGIRSGILLGQYKSEGLYQPIIELWNFSRSNKIVHPSALLRTLLHEFVHHYDNKHLHVELVHSRGFWLRYKQLRDTFVARMAGSNKKGQK